MSNINNLVLEALDAHPLVHSVVQMARPAAKQAAVWGTSALDTHVLSRDKSRHTMTDEEKKLDRKKALTALGAGGAAGAIGTVV